MEKLIKATITKIEYPDVNSLWHESEAEIMTMDHEAIRVRTLEEDGMTTEEISEDQNYTVKSNVMLPIPYRITQKWRESRETCAFEEWTGAPVSRSNVDSLRNTKFQTKRTPIR